MQALIETFFARKEEYLQALIEHMQLSFISLLFAALIAIPLAIYLTSHRKLAESLLQVTGIFQTIPSLALLGLLIPLIGIGRPPAIVALVIYALFPILQNTYTGLTEIDPSLEEAAEAFGMSKKEKLFKFELQMALPFIISGIRTATVLIIGTATLAATNHWRYYFRPFVRWFIFLESTNFFKGKTADNCWQIRSGTRYYY